MAANADKVRAMLVDAGIAPLLAPRIVSCVYAQSEAEGRNPNRLARRLVSTLRRGSVEDGGLRRQINGSDAEGIKAIVCAMLSDPYSFSSPDMSDRIKQMRAESLRMRTLISEQCC